jgi:hypothetical protein
VRRVWVDTLGAMNYSPNHRAALDAAIASCLHFGNHLHRASKAGRQDSLGYAKTFSHTASSLTSNTKTK